MQLPSDAASLKVLEVDTVAEDANGGKRQIIGVRPCVCL